MFFSRFFLLIPLLFISLFCGVHMVKAKEPLFSIRGIGGGGGFFIPSFSPFDPKLLWVTCDMGGMYRSEDAGKSWQMLHWKEKPIEAHLSPPPVHLSPKRSFWIQSINTLTLSEDAGKTWKAIASGPWAEVKAEARRRDKKITSFAVAQDAKDIEKIRFVVSSNFGLWVGNKNQWEQISTEACGHITHIGTDIYALEGGKNLIKSADAGKTWEKIPLPATATAFQGSITKEGTNIFYIGADGQGILRSEDKGKTWHVSSDEFDKIANIYIPQGQTALAYAIQRRHKGLPKVLRTLDGGQTWESIFRMHKEQETFWQEINVQKSWLQSHLYWSYYITQNGFAFSTHNPQELLLATQGELFISRNGGDTWEVFFADMLPPAKGETVPRNKSVGLEVTSSWGYYFDPHEKEREYIAYTDVGFARSLDKGQTWAWSATGSPWTNTFYDLAFDPTVSGKIYAAVSSLHDIPHFTSISKTIPNHRLYAGGIVVSTDFGKTWSVPYKDSSAKKALPKHTCTTVVIDPTSSAEKRTLYAGIFGEGDGPAGVYISQDGGESWQPTPSQPGGKNKHVYRLRIHPKTGDLYCLITGYRAPKPHYFNAEEGGVWRSSDKGKSWTHISKGATLSHWATSMAFHPTDPNALYVSAASPQGIAAGGIYYTKDNGEKWWNILPDKDIKRLIGQKYTYDHWMSVIVHPQKPDILFAGGTRTGLYFSANGGRRWRWYGDFPFKNVQSMSINPHNSDELIITTFGGGIWSASIKALLKNYQIDFDSQR